MKNLKLILAIDTSCDETSVAVTHGSAVLSNIVASQVELHKPYGGVFPTVAKQAHKDNIDKCVELALKRAGVSLAKRSNPTSANIKKTNLINAKRQIDAIAVTQGPGLAPALEVGINKAKELAVKYGLPLIPVNHIEGHLLSVLIKPNPKKNSAVKNTKSIGTKADTKSGTLTKLHPFPTLSIIVSGKHTEFIIVEKIGEYQKIGQTIDDAAGEVLDKIGRMLDLGYPAGAVIEDFAKKGDPQKYKFPLPMTTSGNFNLSFSGLKTFARNLIEPMQASGSLSKQVIYDLCASAQYSIFRHICHKLNKVLSTHSDLGQIWLGGGVAANMALRKMLRETMKDFEKNNQLKGAVALDTTTTLTLVAPYSKKLCGDNAAMIGISANYSHKQNWQIPGSISFKQIDRKPRFSI